MFGTYTIKNIGIKNSAQISKYITKAIERSYGPQVNMDLHFFSYDLPIKDTSYFKEILTGCKETIISLKIPLKEDIKILLHPDLELKNIKRLDIALNYKEHSTHKELCELILAKYGDKLEHFGVDCLRIPENTVFQFPQLPRLESLKFSDASSNKTVNIFVNAINREKITHLSLDFVPDFTFPNLQHLELTRACYSEHFDMIKRHRKTITKLIFNATNGEGSLLNLEDMTIPNLLYLKLDHVYGDFFLELITTNSNTITKLILEGFNPEIHNLQHFLQDVEMKRLKSLYLRDTISINMNGYREAKLKWIKAFGRNMITVLWIFDDDEYKYIRISKEEMSYLKMEALALQY